MLFQPFFSVKLQLLSNFFFLFCGSFMQLFFSARLQPCPYFLWQHHVAIVFCKIETFVHTFGGSYYIYFLQRLLSTKMQLCPSHQFFCKIAALCLWSVCFLQDCSPCPVFLWQLLLQLLANYCFLKDSPFLYNFWLGITFSNTHPLAIELLVSYCNNTLPVNEFTNHSEEEEEE